MNQETKAQDSPKDLNLILTDLSHAINALNRRVDELASPDTFLAIECCREGCACCEACSHECCYEGCWCCLEGCRG
jgi:hypothetical protein